jgi:hypothetical protein
MLTLSVAVQGLQPVSWNCRHVLQFLGVIQHPQLPPCHVPNVTEFVALLSAKQLLGLLAMKGSYHGGR